MKYLKPEIRLLGEAAGVIQGCLKFPGFIDPDLPDSHFTLTPNYDLDE